MNAESIGRSVSRRGARLVEQVQRAARERGLRERTIRAYWSWIVRYVRHCGLRHPRELDASDGERFLEWLAVERRAGAGTLIQARAALAFLYRYVLDEPERRPIRAIESGARSEPRVISPDEAARLFAALSGRNRLAAALMYGAGLRLAECIALRAGDVDVRRRRVHVYAADGRRRVVSLPTTILNAMERQIESVRRQHFLDVRRGGGWVVRRGVAAEDDVVAVRQWQASWLFPAAGQQKHLPSGQWRRQHVSPTTVQRAIAAAARAAGLAGPITPRALRHSCAMQLLRNGYDVYVVRELLGHRDLSTTLRLLGGRDRRPTIRSPLDQILASPQPVAPLFTDARRPMD
jgi:site-specific recombinase XerD